MGYLDRLENSDRDSIGECILQFNEDTATFKHHGYQLYKVTLVQRSRQITYLKVKYDLINKTFEFFRMDGSKWEYEVTVHSVIEKLVFIQEQKD